jgi:hypothetical protein
MQPVRVMRISPEASGNFAMRPLEANKPALSAPTFGTLVNSKLYLIANSQRDQYDANGKIVDGVKPTRRQIYVIDPNFGARRKIPTLPGK